MIRVMHLLDIMTLEIALFSNNCTMHTYQTFESGCTHKVHYITMITCAIDPHDKINIVVGGAYRLK